MLNMIIIDVENERSVETVRLKLDIQISDVKLEIREVKERICNIHNNCTCQRNVQRFVDSHIYKGQGATKKTFTGMIGWV